MNSIVPRFKISSDPSGLIQVRAEEPILDRSSIAAERPKPKPVARVKEGSIEIEIYRQTLRFSAGGKPRRYKSHFFSWTDATGRHRERRASLEDAKARAGDIARSLLNGQTALRNFDEGQRANHLAICRNFARIGQDPVTGSADYASQTEKLRGVDPNATIGQAIDFFLQNRPKNFTALPIADLVKEFLAQKKEEASEKWHSHLAQCLKRFLSSFAGEEGAAGPPLHLLRAGDLNAWVRGLKDSKGNPLMSRSKHNHRAALDELANWAKRNGHLPATWLEMDQVADPGTKMGKVKIWHPNDAIKLLVARQNKEQLGRARKKTMIPFLALQMFAGIRHEEIARSARSKKERLDWRDVHLSERWIFIKAEVSKTGLERTVPIPENLAAWLTPYEKKFGPVCDLRNVSSALTRSKKAANLAAGKNESRNVLRKTWTSYRLQIVKHIGTVAEEAGNSPGMIRKHYRACVPHGQTDGAGEPKQWPLEPDARAWFDIKPEAADILPLFAYGVKRA